MRAAALRATRLKRPLPRSSVSKNSRRHGAGKEPSLERDGPSSTSRAMAVRDRRSSAHDVRAICCSFDLGLGQPDVDRRHVAIALRRRRARRSRARAARSQRRRCRAAGSRDGTTARRPLRRRSRRQMRRDDLAPVLEDRDVELAAAGVVDDRDAADVAGAMASCVDIAQTRLAERQRQALHRGQTDAHAGERAGAARDGEELDLVPVDAGLGQQPVDRRQQLLVARALALERDRAEERRRRAARRRRGSAATCRRRG